LLEWPLREIFLAYIAQLKREAYHSYQTALLVWASKTSMGGKTKAPDLPRILQE
jgi:hypothetical protein